MDNTDPNKFAFIAPFPLDQCKRRLEGRHEKGTLWAWRGQTRLQVNVWDIDRQTAGFRLRRVAKSSLEWNTWTPVKVVGNLTAHSEGRTIVVGEIKTNYLLFYIPFLILWVALSVWIITLGQALNLALLVLATGGVLIGMVAWSFYWIDSQQGQLKGIVRESLGDPEYFLEVS